MIASLTGRVKEVFPQFVILEVNGVGYRIEGLGGVDLLQEREISLYIHTYLREQELRLFGFRTKDELILFEQMLTVSGVGPKSAVGIMNNVGLAKIIEAVTEDKAELLKAPGIGFKTAQKIVIELKNKLSGISASQVKGTSRGSSFYEEATTALSSLGYSQAEMKGVLDKLNYGQITSAEDLIKLALKQLQKFKSTE